MVSYGGIYLPSPTTAVCQHIEQTLSLADVYEWTMRVNPGHKSIPWSFQGHDGPREIELGSLYWPTGAARWATGHFLVTDDDLQKIRVQAYTATNANRYVSLPLVLGEGADRITTSLFMLPPRPLDQIPGQRQLYLLTLVDERWLWWEKSADITVTGGTTTWATLIGDIATALGVTITTDTISSDYLKPGKEFASYRGYLPLLLDAVLSSIGHTLVRKLDGTLVTQTAVTAKASQDLQLTKWSRQDGGGGFFHFEPGPVQDFSALVPASVRAVFPRTDSGVPSLTPHTVSVALSDLALAQYQAGFPGHAGEKVIYSGAVATYTGGASPTNDTELDTLATRLATDFYLWQLARSDTKYAGIVPYAPNGFADSILWRHTEAEVSTRVQRGPWRELEETMPHHGTSGSLPGPGSDSDERVKVSYNDTTPSYLQHKLAAGSNITLTPQNDGGNETLLITASGGGTLELEEGTAVTLSGGSSDDVVIPTEPLVPLSISGGSAVVTGLVAPSPAEPTVRYLYNEGPDPLTLTHEDASSTAANRLLLPGEQPLTIPPGGTLLVRYSTTESRWVATAPLEKIPPKEESITTDQDDYDPAGLTGLVITGADPISITGLAGGAPGRTFTITNDKTTELITLTHDDSSSTAGNRLYQPDGQDLILAPGETANFIYNGTYWVLVQTTSSDYTGRRGSTASASTAPTRGRLYLPALTDAARPTYAGGVGEIITDEDGKPYYRGLADTTWLQGLVDDGDGLFSLGSTSDPAVEPDGGRLVLPILTDDGPPTYTAEPGEVVVDQGGRIYADGGSGWVKVGGGNGVPQTEKIILTYDDPALTGASSGGVTVDIFTLPAKTVLFWAVIKHTEIWDGPTITNVTLTLYADAPTGGEAVLSSLDADLPVTDTEFQATSPGSYLPKLYSFGTATTIQVEVATTGGNTSTLTQGEAEIHLIYTVLP